MQSGFACTVILKGAHAGFRILSATFPISEILAANISKYAAHAITRATGMRNLCII